MPVTVGGSPITPTQAEQLRVALGVDGDPVTTIKPTPVGADRVILLDSAASFAPVLATLASLPGGGGAGALVTVTHNGGSANPVTGDTLTAAFAAGYTGSVQWQRNGTNIAGATNPTYMAVSADEGTTVRPQITSLIYAATGLPVGAAAATVPGALVNGTDWDAQPTATAGEMQYQINALPSNGGSPITALEYRVNTGSAIALTGTGTGNRTVTTGWSAGVAADTQVRAVNAIGPGPWSTPPLPRTPAAGGGGGPATWQAISSFDGDARSGVSVPLPAGTVAADVVVAITARHNTGQVTAPAGWTLIDEVYTSIGLGMAAYVAPGNVAATTWTVGGVIDSAIHIHRISGANTSTPLRDADTGISTNQPDGDFPSPTVTATAGDCVLSVYFQPQSTTAVGTPTIGYTRVLDSVSPNTLSIVQRSNVPGGATGAISHAGNAGFQSRASMTIAIQGA